ncbi:MAG: NAD(P)H-dependent oxidoreductase [Erysipelotrichales bacterium]|nr:NAD(P)H-dependent oxidoreductase [Erysipelotrichales bacterium]
MKLLVSFSGRENGNCDQIARFLCEEDDRVACFRKLAIHGCYGCEYECFFDVCKYHRDDVHSLYKIMMDCEKVVLIVPMYCGNPSSLYFLFNERSQDFFMTHEELYDAFLAKLYIIGVYGSEEEYPDFLPCLSKWFVGTRYTDHVLGIERHKYDMGLRDSVLDIQEIRDEILEFVYRENNELVVESDILTDFVYRGKYLCARYEDILVSIRVVEDQAVMRGRISLVEEYLVSGKYVRELEEAIAENYASLVRCGKIASTLEEYAQRVYISNISVGEDEEIHVTYQDDVEGCLGFGHQTFWVNIDEE